MRALAVDGPVQAAGGLHPLKGCPSPALVGERDACWPRGLRPLTVECVCAYCLGMLVMLRGDLVAQHANTRGERTYIKPDQAMRRSRFASPAVVGTLKATANDCLDVPFMQFFFAQAST